MILDSTISIPANTHPVKVLISGRNYSDSSPWDVCSNYNPDTGEVCPFIQVTPSGSENPNNLGWYEIVNGRYARSSDTSVNSGKTYYTCSHYEWNNTGTADPVLRNGALFVMTSDTVLNFGKFSSRYEYYWWVVIELASNCPLA